MRIFNKYFIPVLLAAVVFSCNPLEDLYEEVDDKSTDAPSSPINYEFGASDYAGFAKYLKGLKTKEDTIKANFIEAHGFVTSDATISEYLEDLVTSEYPQWGIGTSVLVSYDFYNGSVPDYSAYTAASKYTLKTEDYVSVGGTVADAKFFYPSAPASSSLSSILNSAIQDAVSGEIYEVTYQASSENAVLDYSTAGAQTVFDEGFDADLSGVSVMSVEGDIKWYYSTRSGDGYAASSSYSGGVNYANEDWMITPKLDLTGMSDASMTILQAAYITIAYPVTDVISILVSKDFDGTNVSGATWTDVSSKVDVWPTRTGSNGYSANTTSVVDLSDFDGEKIYVAFRFKMTADQVTAGNSVTWQVYDVNISAEGSGPTLTSKAPVAHIDYYTFGGSSWSKVSNVYALNAYDYNAMGETSGLPGRYDNFSSTAEPEDYLPSFLTAGYPYAQEGTEIMISYKYYNGSATVTRVDKYSFIGGAWVTDYFDTEVKTDQIKKNSTGYVFDPSVELTMGSTEYQLVVDHVKNVIALEAEHQDETLVDGFGTAEFYYGSSAYYRNFDIRLSKRNAGAYAQKAYEGLSEEEGNALIIERMGEGVMHMLEAKYPDANVVEGIDVTYTVYAQSYDGGYANWKFVYTVTGKGTFEASEDPAIQ